MNFVLFGYPKSGKTTLFNLLTQAKIETKNYSSRKKEPNLRICLVPDERLDKLAALYPKKQKKPAIIDFVDLAGISYGQMKNSAYLDYLRKADGLIHVVRGFYKPQISYPKGRVSPIEDIEAIEEELILADLISIENRLEKLKKEMKRGKQPELDKEKITLESLSSQLEQGIPIREIELSASEEKTIRNFSFLTQKPLLHMINIDEKDIPHLENPRQIFPLLHEDKPILAFCGKIESEIMEFEEEEEKNIFLKEYGLKETSVNRFLRTSYKLLGVITFYTIGKEEVKAWTIKKNRTALQAAGLIHTDIAKGFIRAEVISINKLLEFTSFQIAKEKGALRLEGKDYLVQDGDVIYFRFSP